ncbi:hypothetical protein OG604_36305 [Streptomyces sp. NBC_01231]|nr:hypothetical protein OG604_36305 [Streptomyces sp. NBC_01231]
MSAGGDGTFRAVLTGALVGSGAAGTVWGCGRMVCVGLARQRVRQWDEEWEEADMRWGGKTG